MPLKPMQMGRRYLCVGAVLRTGASRRAGGQLAALFDRDGEDSVRAGAVLVHSRGGRCPLQRPLLQQRRHFRLCHHLTAAALEGKGFVAAQYKYVFSGYWFSTTSWGLKFHLSTHCKATRLGRAGFPYCFQVEPSGSGNRIFFLYIKSLVYIYATAISSMPNTETASRSFYSLHSIAIISRERRFPD